MHFFTLVMLPPETDIGTEEVLLAAVKAAMWPYRDPTCVRAPDEDDVVSPLARWDGYTVSPFDALRHYGYRVPEGASNDDLLVVRVTDLEEADFLSGGRMGEPDVLTATGEWLQGPKTGGARSLGWTGRAEQVLADHKGHHGMLLHCHF